jgi:hypothetical protein
MLRPKAGMRRQESEEEKEERQAGALSRAMSKQKIFSLDFEPRKKGGSRVLTHKVHVESLKIYYFSLKMAQQ